MQGSLLEIQVAGSGWNEVPDSPCAFVLTRSLFVVPPKRNSCPGVRQLPELPEVETMVRGIGKYVTNRTIVKLLACPNHCRPISLTPSLKQLQKRLVGQKFTAVRRLGKRVVFDVDDGSNLVIEPRMTGLMVLGDPPDVEHLRLEWQFDNEQEYDSLFFWDRRGLGTIRLFLPGEMNLKLGPDVVGTDALEMTVAGWTERCSKSRRPIKILLLDQKIVAGIGNLYASEILHVASVDPTAEARSLKRKCIERIAAATHAVLSKAIEYEGSTLGDGTYRNALNQNGRYQNEHRVYKREGKSCLICQKAEIVRIVQGQRSTFYCPRCQRAE